MGRVKMNHAKKYKFMRGKKLLFVILVMSIASAALAASNATVYVSPLSISNPALTYGKTFSVYISIDSISSLYAYDFKLKYNPSILKAVNVTTLQFLNNPNFVVKKTANAKTGVIQVSATSLRPALPKSGSGNLAVITFQVIGTGETVLDLYDVKLSSPTILPILSLAKDGYFNNKPPSPSPQEPVIE